MSEDITTIRHAARCASCKHTMNWTPPPSQAANELPMCPKCFSPMLVESATDTGTSTRPSCLAAGREPRRDRP